MWQLGLYRNLEKIVRTISARRISVKSQYESSPVSRFALLQQQPQTLE